MPPRGACGRCRERTRKIEGPGLRPLLDRVFHPLPPSSPSPLYASSSPSPATIPRRKGLRTGPAVLDVLAKDLRHARTFDEVRAAASALPSRLLSTGAFQSVSVGTAPSASTPGGTDLVVDLDESTFSVTTNATQSLSGSLSTAAEVSVMNLLGQAETISGRVGSASGDLSMGGIGELLSSSASATSSMSSQPGAAASMSSSSSSSSASSAVQRTAEMLTTPTFLFELRKPTLGEARTPVGLRLRREVEYHDVTSGFRNTLLEGEASITDPSNTHSVSYTCAWRNLSPLRAAGGGKLFASGSSPEVVANCDASLKSSVAYSYVRSRLNAGKTPSAGHKSVFRAEVAGAGGDVQFVRAAFNGLYAASLLRFAPDTGYALPQHKAAFVASLNGQPQQDDDGSGPQQNPLAPHPGPGLLSLWGRVLSGQTRSTDPAPLVTSPKAAAAEAARWGSRQHHPRGGLGSGSGPGSEYTLAHRVAGWLSPGVTAHFDLSLGLLVPFGASAARPYGTRIVDRFFMHGARFRGFDSIGPKSDPVDGGNALGDVLGGDALAAATARLLLPPPLPSVRLANAGLRTQAFVSVGALGPADPSSLLGKVSASAGVGLVSFRVPRQ
jgi:outer membrane protein assembly factor BamA